MTLISPQVTIIPSHFLQNINITLSTHFPASTSFLALFLVSSSFLHSFPPSQSFFLPHRLLSTAACSAYGKHSTDHLHACGSRLSFVCVLVASVACSSSLEMANRLLKRLLHDMYHNSNLISRKGKYQRYAYGLINRCQSQLAKGDDLEPDVAQETKRATHISLRDKFVKNVNNNFRVSTSSSDEDLTNNRWRLELNWLTKAIEPALQLCRWALPAGNVVGNKLPPSGQSLAEIITSIQRSKIGFEGWSLSDLTIGLYLIYLRQASINPFEDVKGVQILSESMVQDLIYHLELAHGCYKGSATGLSETSMLRESDVLKFIKESSVMRPGYYIAIDQRKKLIILGIRGTHTVYDLITDIVSSSDGEVTFEGYSTHFGTTEAARWFLNHEMETIKKCLEKYEGFRLRLVGHSLGGAAAALLAIMLRRKSHEELGFSPDIVSAVGYGTPPCVSRGLAESCSGFVTNVVMQDDVVPRLSVAALARLRTEILQTDWMSVVEQSDWKSFMGLVTNAKQAVSSVQDVAQKLADYAKFRSNETSLNGAVMKESLSSASKPTTKSTEILVKDQDASEELFIPGTVYCLKRNFDPDVYTSDGVGMEFYTLLKRDPGEHFQRIILSNNIISDHKCETHHYALRDVIKGLPGESHESIF